MSYTAQQQVRAQVVPVDQMNLRLLNLYVKMFNEGQALSPSKERLVKAVLELQNAYAAKDHWENTEAHTWPHTDSEMFDRAVRAFGDGDGRPMHWGVRQEHIPRNAIEGDKVIIHSFFMNERIIHEGKVVRVIDFPTSTGWIIELHEVVDHYLAQAPRSKYVSLWASHDTRIMAGFMLGT
jgi:hypothetical protein